MTISARRATKKRNEHQDLSRETWSRGSSKPGILDSTHGRVPATDGIVCGRLERRLPEAERWDRTGWQDLKGVPWDLRPTGVPALEIDQSKDGEKKGKQPGNGTQEPKQKTARDRDPRTQEENRGTGT